MSIEESRHGFPSRPVAIQHRMRHRSCLLPSIEDARSNFSI
jgi:hypothetical protein